MGINRVAGAGFVGLCAISLGVGCGVENKSQLPARYDAGPDFAYEDPAVDESFDNGEPNWAFDDFGYGTDIWLNSGHITGQLGTVSVDHDGTFLHGYSDGYWTTLFTVVEEADGGAAMAVIDLSGGLDHPDFQPGSTRTYEFSGPLTGNSETHVTVIGCSGNEVDNWEYDEPAEKVEITVDEVPGQANTLEVSYVASFGNPAGSPSEVTGSVIFRLPTETVE